MKKNSSLFAMIAGFFLLFAFVSCSEILGGNNETGSVSFTFDKDFVQKIEAEARSAAASETEVPYDEQYKNLKKTIEFTIALTGDYYDRQTVSFDLGNSEIAGYTQTIKFDKVAIGASIRAVCLVEMVNTENYDGEEHSFRHLFGLGVSPNSVSIKSGNNTMELPVKSVHFSSYDGFFGTAAGWDGQFCLSLCPDVTGSDGSEDSLEGFYGITNYTYGGFVSGGRYKLLSSGNDSFDVEITEYVYISQEDMKKTAESPYSGYVPTYQFVKNPKTEKLASKDNRFSVVLANEVKIDFGMFNTYTMSISKDGNSVYSDSGTWYRADDSDSLDGFNDAVKGAFGKVGLTVTPAYYKEAGNIGFTYILSGEATTFENEAFFPTGYDASKVKAWFSNFDSEEKSGTYQTKFFALYLFDDGTVLATKLKYKNEPQLGNSIEKEIERIGTYTLTESGNFETNSGTATFKFNGESDSGVQGEIVKTYKFGIFNNVFFAYDTEEPEEGEGIQIYTKRSDAVPAASDPTKIEIDASSGEVTATVKKATIVLDSPEKDSDGNVTLNLNGALQFNLIDAETGKNVNIKESGNCRLLYGGNEVDSSYYEVSETGRFAFKKSLLTAGTYQLYVELKGVGEYYEPYEMSSATFDIKVNDEYGAINTQAALYQKNGNDGYNYYLVNPENVGSATLENPVLQASSTKTAFDMYGNFYCLDGITLKSNNDKIGTAGVELTQLSSVMNYYHNFIIDLANNNAYVWVGNQNGYLTLYKYPSLLTKGTVTDVEDNNITYNGFTMAAQYVAVYNNIFYIVGTYNSNAVEIVSYDFSGDAPVQNLAYNLTGYISSALYLSSNWTITDAYAVNDALYLLVKDRSYSSEFSVWNSAGADVYNRGAVIKYVAAINGNTESINCRGLVSTPAFTNTAIPKMQLYYNNDGPLYSEYSETEVNTSPILTIDGTLAVKDGSTTTFNAYFPNVYAVSSDTEEYFASPAKIIAVTPKKLVIADDGIAYYVDSDGVFSYKNLNRVITIDLEEFTIDSVQTTKAEFESNIKGYLHSDGNVSLSSIDSENDGSCFTENDKGYYYYASTHRFEEKLLTGSDVYFAIKNGDSN